MQPDFIELKPGLLVNKQHIIWMQHIGECMYVSQRDKINKICNNNKPKNINYNNLLSLFKNKNNNKKSNKNENEKPFDNL